MRVPPLHRRLKGGSRMLSYCIHTDPNPVKVNCKAKSLEKRVKWLCAEDVAWLAGCLAGMHSALGLSPFWHKLGPVAHNCNPCIWEVEPGESEVYG